MEGLLDQRAGRAGASALYSAMAKRYGSVDFSEQEIEVLVEGFVQHHALISARHCTNITNNNNKTIHTKTLTSRSWTKFRFLSP